jgi:ribosomal protein S18 acetylase RimI-like enzyme
MTDPQLEPLRAERVGGLRFLLGSRFTQQSLNEYLALNPGLSWRAAENGQYVVGGYWRRRPDIAGVVELASGRFRQELVAQLVHSAQRIGCELVVGEAHEGDSMGAFWREVGFEPVDLIVEYERLGRVQADPPAIGLRLYEPDDLRPLIDLERRSFPWLWWNSTAELARYGEAHESEIWVMDGPQGSLAAYLGITVRGTHGHLDRLAVAPESRRAGIGTALVAHALSRFGVHGVLRVTLTTQHDNVRAQPLYERTGFRLTRHRLTIYGRWLGQPRDRTP